MTDKSETVEQRAREIYGQAPDVFWNPHSETRGYRHWGDLTEERREHFRELVRAFFRPADQVPDMVEDSDDYFGPMFEPVCREIERTCPEVTAGARGFLARRITMLIERAALQAVPVTSGEPTEAMVEAGCQQWTSWGHAEPVESVVKRIYAAMRAALKASGEE